MSTAAIGVEERIDIEARRHPWRIVVRSDSTNRDWKMALPKATQYLQDPRHHLYGDLTELPAKPADAITAVMDDLIENGISQVIMANEHLDEALARALRWNGIATSGIDVTYEGDLREDPFSIGGDAGHEIAQIEHKTRTRE